jgi:hypothetical protein
MCKFENGIPVRAEAQSGKPKAESLKPESETSLYFFSLWAFAFMPRCL